MKQKNAYSNTSNLRLFRGVFGASTMAIAIVWNLLVGQGTVPEGGKPSHLLWELFFIKTYANEEVLSSTFGTDKKTSRKWVWLFLEAIADLEEQVVSLFMMLYYVLTKIYIYIYLN